MDWLNEILGLGASAASGGLFGILGAGIGAFAKYFQRRQEMEAERERRAHELMLIEAQQRTAAAETENELRIIDTKAAADLREASYQMPISVSGVHMWVNDVRSLFRPLLTAGLVAGAFWIVWLLVGRLDARDGGVLAQVIGPDEAADLVGYGIRTLIFLAATAVAWWYGERSMQPPGASSR